MFVQDTDRSFKIHEFFSNSREVFPINECLEHWRAIIPTVYSMIKQIKFCVYIYIKL